MRTALVVLVLATPLVAAAQVAAPPAPAVPAPPAAPLPDGTPPPAGPAEPRVQRLVAEDDGVRIEELRVRGQTQRLVVRPKGGAAAYEIVPADGARDLSAGPGSTRGAAGQRQWPVLSF